MRSTVSIIIQMSPLHITKKLDYNLDQRTVCTTFINYPELLSLNSEIAIANIFVEEERIENPLKNIEEAHNYLENLVH